VTGSRTGHLAGASVRLSIVFGLAVLPGAAGCGGSVCGNGEVESGEQCDDGNDRNDDSCTNSCAQHLTLDAQIVFSFLAQEGVVGFNENCSGVGAKTVRLELTGPMTDTQDVECTFGQYTFKALVPGTYQVKGTMLDSTGAALTMGDSVTGFTIAAQTVSASLNFAFADFIGAYQGNWFYRFKWGGANTCAGAIPPVTMATIRLERDGVPVMTTTGTVVDGLTPGACFDASDVGHAINDLPWGAATLTVTGLDSTGTPQFMETFPTFLGAGVSNPILEYDVNSLAPDAGVPDAGPPDAAPGPPGPIDAASVVDAI
jgi:cysteine-rich repeat protein